MRQSRPEVSSVDSTRSVPCSMRCTGRPRPIPNDDSTRCMTRSTAGTCCSGRGVQARRNAGAPGIDQITLAEVEEYGVSRLLDELEAELRAGTLPSDPGPAGIHTQARDPGAEAVVDSRGP